MALCVGLEEELQMLPCSLPLQLRSCPPTLQSSPLLLLLLHPPPPPPPNLLCSCSSLPPLPPPLPPLPLAQPLRLLLLRLLLHWQLLASAACRAQGAPPLLQLQLQWCLQRRSGLLALAASCCASPLLGWRRQRL